MPQFSYQAMTDDDRLVEGQVEAADIESARRMLEADGLTVQVISQLSPAHDQPIGPPVSEDSAASPSGQAPSDRSGDSTPRGVDAELQALQMQVARIMNAGEPLASALQAYAAELPAGKQRRQLRQIAAQLEQGGDPSGVLASRQVAEQWIPLLSAAAASGDPSQILRNYLSESQRANEGGRRLAFALAYPAVVFLFAVTVMTLICGLVVPTFREIMEDFSLPSMTVVVLEMSRIVTETGGLVIVVPLVAVIGSLLAVRYLLPSSVCEWMTGWVPVLGRGVRMASLARFTQYLADLIEANVSVAGALRIAGRIAQRRQLRVAANRMASFVESGGTDLKECPAAKLLPATVLHSLQLDSSPGTRARLLRELSWIYDNQTRERLSWVHGIIEPLTICVIGVLVAFVVFALLGPLASLVTNLS